MLGWEFFVTKQPGQDSESNPALLASWMTGINGTNWLINLVSSGAATDLGGNGYPDSYLVSAGTLREILANGPPSNNSPLTIGDDYANPKGWIKIHKIDLDAFLKIDPALLLLVEAWDQS